MEQQALWEIWQDFGVVGIPATDSAGSIRVYTHSTETRSSAPTAVILRQRGQREGTMFSGLGYRRRLALTASTPRIAVTLVSARQCYSRHIDGT